MARIFLSGPMFSPADLWEQQQIQSVLVDAGFDTYLAATDGIEDEELIDQLQSPLMALTAFQQLALFIQKVGWTLGIYMATFGCDGMVFNMNGRVPDEGSVAEAANAFAVGMPVVTYKDTSITMWGSYDNPMVAALNRSWHPVTSYAEIPPALNAALATRDSDYEYVPPPYFAADLEIGKFVHEHRDEVMAVLKSISKLGDTLVTDLDKLWHWFLGELGLSHLHEQM